MSTSKHHAITQERRVEIAKAALFAGVFPGGIVYADHSRDHQQIAFLPYSTLELQWSKVDVSPQMRALIEADAAKMHARRGEHFRISASGHTVLLGEDSVDWETRKYLERLGLK